MSFCRHNYRNWLLYFAVLSFSLLINPCLCQTNEIISIGVGTANYLGELSPYNTPIKAIISPAIRWNVAASFQQPITKQISLRTGFTYARLFGDDNLYETVKATNYLRNLHFRNDIKELSIDITYSFYKKKQFYRHTHRKVEYYLHAGIGVFSHNPMARDIRLSQQIKGDWVKLRELKTEGQVKEYSSLAFSFPIGLEMQYRINKLFGIGFEVKYNLSSTDYIDDVSTTFPTISNTIFTNRSAEFIAAISGKDRLTWVQNYLNNNGYTNIDAIDIASTFPSGIPPFDTAIATRQRGNPKVKDGYILTKFSLLYYLPEKIKCPKIK
jgi:hypothetical protein